MLTSLEIVLFVLKCFEVLAVLIIAIITVDFLCFEYQEWRKKNVEWAKTTERLLAAATVAVASATASHIAIDQLLEDSKVRLAEAKERDERRYQKEQEARQSFFDDGYFRGFDANGQLIYRGATAPSGQDWAFFEGQDKVADSQIFENTREI